MATMFAALQGGGLHHPGLQRENVSVGSGETGGLARCA